MKIGAFIIPTGIGASIGGFAGDASKWAGRISTKHKLIVNPNVVNAACFSGIKENMLYLEGYSMDEFFKGHLNLLPSCRNKIGVIFDKQIPKDVLNIHINTMNAVKTVYDVDIVDFVITKENTGVKFFIDSSGASSGNIKNPDTIVEAGKTLLAKGVDALAIVCSFPEDQGNAPQGGQAHQGVDHPAGHAGLPAEEGGHDVEAEQADAAPVEPADDGQDQGQFIKEHRIRSLLQNGFPGLVSAVF